MKRKALYGLMALSLGVAPAAWAEMPRYMITDLGHLKPELKGDGNVSAVAINNKGQILGSAPISITYDSVGNVEAETHTFLYSKGRMKDLVEELGAVTMATILVLVLLITEVTWQVVMEIVFPIIPYYSEMAVS